jgi:threonine/homoserine efflux transporter RhtA
MDQLGKKTGRESLTKRALFSLLFAAVVAIVGATAFFDFFFAAAAGEAAITAMRIPNTIFFIVLNPLFRPAPQRCTQHDNMIGTGRRFRIPAALVEYL